MGPGGSYPKQALLPEGLKEIFPDLIFHRRTEREENALMVEIKLGGSARPADGLPQPDAEDLLKVKCPTGAPLGMLPYEWGLCLDLRPREAFLHWVCAGHARPVETWTAASKTPAASR